MGNGISDAVHLEHLLLLAGACTRQLPDESKQGLRARSFLQLPSLQTPNMPAPMQGLNDVSVGGLSSYSLCNMVIAHLQEELKVRGGRSTCRVACCALASLQQAVQLGVCSTLALVWLTSIMICPDALSAHTGCPWPAARMCVAILRQTWLPNGLHSTMHFCVHHTSDLLVKRLAFNHALMCSC